MRFLRQNRDAFAAAMILAFAVISSGAAAWVFYHCTAALPVLVSGVALSASQQKPEPAQEKTAPPPAKVTRTVRGIVRDENGRPVVRARIGNIF